MTELKRGDRVKKSKGFQYRGTLLGILEKLDGTPIALVEHELEKGMVHVYQPHQLELRDD
jgi:hypothetical protein